MDGRQIQASIVGVITGKVVSFPVCRYLSETQPPSQVVCGDLALICVFSFVAVQEMTNNTAVLNGITLLCKDGSLGRTAGLSGAFKSIN
jgi:hypothetical protein